jgi:hypothetical protein
VDTTNYKRYLKYRLHPADVLFFRTIAGNQGEALYPLLDAHFALASIFPSLNAESETAFTRYSEQARTQFRLVRGDFEYGTGDTAVYRYIARNPIKTTVLRHPVNRAVALYQQALASNQIDPAASLNDYLTTASARHQLPNAQARAIVGQTTRAVMAHETLGYSLAAFKKLAEDNLEQHHFFGLAEELRPSLQLLHYTFDWDYLDSGPAKDSSSLEVSVEDQASISELAGYDLEFYEFAQTLFRRRYRQMVDELLEAEAQSRKTMRAAVPALAAPNLLGRLKSALQRRLFGQKPRSTGYQKRKRKKSPKQR